MNIIGNIPTSITEGYCHSELMEIFSKLANNKKLRLFAITTDIDNLGVYVAHYGRAMAQNLVDYYINILGEYICLCQQIISVRDIFYVPAGEETTIIGLVNHPDQEKSFTDNLSAFLHQKTTECPFETGLTAISFGSHYFEDGDLYQRVYRFMNDIESKTIKNISKEYYDILLLIREAVSPKVDAVKFASLGISKLEDLVFIRNLIYSELLTYKHKTQQLLPKVVKRLSTLQMNEDLNKYYGLTAAKHLNMRELISTIKNEDKGIL